MIFIVDYVIGKLEKNKPILRFVSKNLSWGVFKQAMTKSEDDAELNAELSSMDYFQQLIQADPALRLRAPETMLFLIAELASSACYSTILENEPVSFEELKPDLYNAIRAIIRAHALPAPSLPRKRPCSGRPLPKSVLSEMLPSRPQVFLFHLPEREHLVSRQFFCNKRFLLIFA